VGGGGGLGLLRAACGRGVWEVRVGMRGWVRGGGGLWVESEGMGVMNGGWGPAAAAANGTE